MKILLISAYDAMSHRYWRESLVAQLSAYQWTTLILPARFYSFRVLGNPLSFFSQYQQQLSVKYDLVIATSMVDMSTLRGVFPALANTPLWLYCHENQFVYPESEHQEQKSNKQQIYTRVQAQMTFLYSSLAAEKISFNSQWNLDSSMQGLMKLIKKLPEKIETEIVTSIALKSDVLPVPLPDIKTDSQADFELRSIRGERLKILWNHRWEYDKGPEYLLAFVKEVVDQKFPCDFYINGQQFKRHPECFKEIEQRIGEAAHAHLRSFGYIEDRDEYNNTLDLCDVVISTSLHDFQGLSVLEAVQLGCIPLLPNRLVYPEIFSSEYLYHFDSNEYENALNMLQRITLWRETGLPGCPDLSGFCWKALGSSYKQGIESFKVTI